MDRCDILPNDCGSDDVAFAKDLCCVVGRAVALVVFSLFSYSFQLFPYQMVMVVLMAKAAERSSLGVAFRGGG